MEVLLNREMRARNFDPVWILKNGDRYVFFLTMAYAVCSQESN